MKRFATLLALVAVAVADRHVLVTPGLYNLGQQVYNPYLVANPLIYGRPLVKVQPELKELRKQYETVKAAEDVKVYTRPEQIRPDQIRREQIRPDQIRPDQIRPDQIRPEVNVYEKRPEVISPFEKRPEVISPFEKRPEVNVYEKKSEIAYARPEQVNTVFPGFTTPVRYAAASGRVQHVVSKREADSNLYINPFFGYSLPPYYTTPQVVYGAEQPKTYISPATAPEQKTVADFASAHTPLYADKGRYFADSQGARMIAKRDTESFYPFYSNVYSNLYNAYNPYYATRYSYGYPYGY